MSETQEKLLNLLYRVLRPFARLLIESGIGHRQFAEVAKRAYVDVALKNYGIRGRETNISRVAVMTGLTRKEVKRVKDQLKHERLLLEARPLPPSVVLQHWYSDPEFLDESGSPLPLNFTPEAPSFLDLAKKCAGDIPAGALRTELKRSGAIKESSGGKLEPVRRTYRVLEPAENFAWSLERGIYAAVVNAAHNYFEKLKPESARTSSWPARMVEVPLCSDEALRKARTQIGEKVTEFTEQIDDILLSHSDSDAGTDRSMTTVMVGVLYLEREDTE